VAQIAASIKEFGFTNPILIDDEGSIIAGHGRVMAARKLLLDTVPTITLSGLSDIQKRAYIIADNKLALNAGWDNELLMLELNALSDADYDLDLTGFSADEISDLMPEQLTEGLTDEDAVPDVPEIPHTVLGDVWLLGKHRVMCGDSTSVTDMDSLMNGNLANMLHTDPPYGVDFEGVTNDHLKAEALKEFLTSALTTAYTALHEGSNVYVWHADITAYEFIGAFRESGFKQARPSTIQWVKPSLTMSQGDYHSQNEPCLYGWKEGKGRVRVADRKQTTVWNIARTTENKVQTTMKPVELCERAIINSSMPNSIVLDSFRVSGSTLIACEKTGRICVTMELFPAYVDVIVKRWQEFTGRKAIHADTGIEFPA
jgi:DNA modification methylase